MLKPRGQSDGSMGKKTCCTCRGLWFTSQHPHEGSQMSPVPTAGHLTLLTPLGMKHLHSAHTYMQTFKHMNKKINIFFKKKKSKSLLNTGFMIYSDWHYTEHWKPSQWPQAMLMTLRPGVPGPPEEHSESHLFIETAPHIAWELLILPPSPQGMQAWASMPSFKIIQGKKVLRKFTMQ